MKTRFLYSFVCLFWLVFSLNCSRKPEKEAPAEERGADSLEEIPVTPKAQKQQSDRMLRLNEEVPPEPENGAPHERAMKLAEPVEPGSWQVVRPVAVYRKADTESEIMGAIGNHTHLPRVQRIQGKGCTAGFFLKLAEGAFVCGTNLALSKQPPSGRREPVLGANNLTPGTYGFIRTGGTELYSTLQDGFEGKNGVPIRESDTVRWAGRRQFRDMNFWRITTGQFVRADRVRRFWPSVFAGVNLQKTNRRLPLVFMVGRRRREIGEKLPPVDVHEAPGGRVVKTLERYTAWPVDDIRWQDGQRWFHIPREGWVTSEMTRLARRTDPPGELHPDESWLDVDLEEQVLTAYRGRTPVYTTLVSAGVWKYPTPTGVFRIYHKKAEADMRADPASDDQYRVDHVPWTMYFQDGYALHGAYWHDGFGHARSHGCINLAPKDAEFIYHFTYPAVPPGWTALQADESHPGTAIRIRGKCRVESSEDVREKEPENSGQDPGPGE